MVKCGVILVFGCFVFFLFSQYLIGISAALLSVPCVFGVHLQEKSYSVSSLAVR